MLLERKDGAGKKKKGRIVIGYDLGDTHAQISYYFLHRDAQRADDMSGGEDSRKDALQKEASKKDSSRRGPRMETWKPLQWWRERNSIIFRRFFAGKRK